jgi:hypothetical protein
VPFWLSISLLSLAQGALVAVPRFPATIQALTRLEGRRWAIVPPLSVIAFVFIARTAEQSSAEGLTYLALIAVPLLAALTLGWLSPGAAPIRALLVVPVFALAWADRGHLPGQAAALILSALSCASLGALIAAVTPRRWLAGGIVAMAAADATLVTLDLLQKPNNALNAAHPAAGLPRLQDAVLGSAVMGYGDLFIAGALGGLLAVSARGGADVQLRAAALAALLALCFDLLFFVLNELPATVPVALTLILLCVSGAPARAGRARPARPRVARSRGVP